MAEGSPKTKQRTGIKRNHGRERAFPAYELRKRTEFEPGRSNVYVFHAAHCPGDEEELVALAGVSAIYTISYLPDYVTQIWEWVMGGSNNCINVYERSTLQCSNSIGSDCHGSEGTITSLLFANHALWSACTDGMIRSWDLRRSSKKAVCVLQGHSREPFNCIAANPTSKLLAGGTDKVGEDASIYIWDLRTGRAPITQFTESHSDDITQVKFSPRTPNYLASGSTDGLICLFDLSTMEEEEALISVKNSESSVANIGFYGPNSEHVYCLTHQESFHVWGLSEVEPIASQSNLRGDMADKFGIWIDYLVNCHYQKPSEKLYLVAGDHRGGLHILHASLAEMQPLGLITGGHTSTVRCINWDDESGSIISGGEDGIVCLWQATVKTSTSQTQ